jgi:hypothetical protein
VMLRPPPRDGVADAPPPQVGAVPPAGVAFVAHDTTGTQPRSPASRSLHGTLLQQGHEGRRFVAVPWREDERQRLATTLRAEMDLRRDAALTAPERFRRRIPPLLPPRAGGPGSRWRRQSAPSNRAGRRHRPGVGPPRRSGPTRPPPSSGGSACTRSARVHTAPADPATAPRSPASRGCRRGPAGRSSVACPPCAAGAAAAAAPTRRRILHLQEVLDCQHKSPPSNLPIEDRP